MQGFLLQGSLWPINVNPVQLHLGLSSIQCQGGCIQETTHPVAFNIQFQNGILWPSNKSLWEESEGVCSSKKANCGSALSWWCVHTVCDEQSWSPAAEDTRSSHTSTPDRATEVQYQAFSSNGRHTCGFFGASSGVQHCDGCCHYFPSSVFRKCHCCDICDCCF